MTASLPPLAHRISGYRPSKVREIFAKASAPGVISLAGGSPFLGTMPFAELAAQASEILSEQGRTALQYSFGVGTPELRQQIVEIMRLEGIEADPSEVLVTAGSQMALEAICKVMLDPGDVVIAESPCYAGGLSALRGYDAEVLQVATDDQGMVPEALEEMITASEADGRRVKMVYCIPTFQNPANTVLPPERREEIVQICRDHGVLLLEDNAYGLLSFDGSYHRAMKADHPDQIAYMGSFSKMFGPGLRLGWIVPPPEYRQALLDTIETFILNPPTMGQLQMVAYLTGYDWMGQVERMRALYASRCDALDGALRASMPEGVTWQKPTGSFYLWLTLPEGLDSERLMDAALERGVAVVPGTAFHVDGGGHDTVRLSYCLPTEEELAKAGAILGEVVSELVAG